jgi:hypothetical protein
MKSHLMKSIRLTSAFVVSLVCVVALLDCGSSQSSGHQPTGVTNLQPPSPAGGPYWAPVREGQCVSSAATCSTNMECCSQWCENERCVSRQP